MAPALSALLLAVAHVATASPAAACTDPVVEEAWQRHPPGLCAMPDDVRAMVEAYDTCQHFLGEEPYDDERRAEINSAIGEFCAPALSRLERVKRHHRDEAQVSAWLHAYEAQTDFDPVRHLP